MRGAYFLNSSTRAGRATGSFRNGPRLRNAMSRCNVCWAGTWSGDEVSHKHAGRCGSRDVRLLAAALYELPRVAEDLPKRTPTGLGAYWRIPVKAQRVDDPRSRGSVTCGVDQVLVAATHQEDDLVR